MCCMSPARRKPNSSPVTRTSPPRKQRRRISRSPRPTATRSSARSPSSIRRSATLPIAKDCGAALRRASSTASAPTTRRTRARKKRILIRRRIPACPATQTLVPLMLDHVSAGRLSLLRFVDLTSAGPARVFGIARKGRIAAGYDADLTVVDLKRRETITDKWTASRAGWTPYNGVSRHRLAGRHHRAWTQSDVGRRACRAGARRARVLFRNAGR